MKRILMMIAFCSVVYANTQDVIIKNDGNTIVVKVLEVSEAQVKYKKFSNLDGPTYTLLKSECMTINYQNGQKDVFDCNVTTSSTPPKNQYVTKHLQAII